VSATAATLATAVTTVRGTVITTDAAKVTVKQAKAIVPLTVMVAIMAA
jgi:hypothetical protein